MEIHIGKIIEKRVKETGISVSKLAKGINTTRNNIYDIYTRKSIDTDLLYKIGQILDCDFFQLYITRPVSEKKARIVVELELSQDEILNLGLNEKIFKVTKSQ